MDMERGYHRPTVEMAVRLADVFGTDLSYFDDNNQENERKRS
jgi:hypothetical protein